MQLTVNLSVNSIVKTSLTPEWVDFNLYQLKVSNSLLAKQNTQILHTLSGIIDQLDDAEYTGTKAPYYNSSIGAHTRHILDHYLMFIVGLSEGIIDYDKRCRNPEIETCRSRAKLTIDRITAALEGLPDTNTRVAAKLNIVPSGDTPAQHSTIGRELTFLYSHTVHHHSIIAIIMRLMEKEVSSDIGYAPSTLNYQNETKNKTTCAH